MVLALDFVKESQMSSIHTYLLEAGLIIVLAIELYKFIKFILKH
jgi:hypothetical protein